MESKQEIKSKFSYKYVLLHAVLIGSLCANGSVNATTDVLFNQTKVGLVNAIVDACTDPAGVNTSSFQARCNELVGAAVGPDGVPGDFRSLDGLSDDVINGVNQISAEQQTAPGVQAARTMQSTAGVANAAVVSRMNVLRAQMLSPRAMYYANSSQQGGLGRFSFASGLAQSGGSAGIADSSRLGLWGNGSYTTGNVDTSNNQLGFGFDNWGGTFGVDYRVTDNIVAGAAFSYLGSDANISNSASSVKSDSYTGSIFSMYSHDSGFYVDGVASYGAVEFDITRSIQYTVSGVRINSLTTGKPSGSQYSFGAGIGYQHNVGATSIEPFVRVNFQTLEINSFDESDVGQDLGWASRFSKQRIRSLPTSVGLRLSRAISTSWGVIQPQIHGAWHHEFKDNQRTISTSFLGSGNNRSYDVLTARPDRNYFIAGASLSATLPYGITAFTGYNTILGYQNIMSHRVTFGGRMEF